MLRRESPEQHGTDLYYNYFIIITLLHLRAAQPASALVLPWPCLMLGHPNQQKLQHLNSLKGDPLLRSGCPGCKPWNRKPHEWCSLELYGAAALPLKMQSNWGSDAGGRGKKTKSEPVDGMGTTREICEKRTEWDLHLTPKPRQVRHR